MFPACNYRDSHPQSFPNHGNYMPYSYYYYPDQEAFPPQAFTSTHKPASSFGPWPHHSNISNQKDECIGCCIHSHPSMYYNFRPPYPHVRQPHFYFHGPHPYHEAYPPYFVPSPHHPFDQIRPDSNMVHNNCCGCPHHAWNKMDNQGLKIEERNPEAEQRSSDSSLIRSSEYPPVVWVPANFVNNRETSKSSQEHPSVSNGWIPLDINSLKSLMQSLDHKDKVPADQKKNQFSWPFSLMRDCDNSKEMVKDLKEVNGSPQIAEEARPQLKIIPLRLLEHEDRGDKPETMEDKLEAMSGKESKTKIIPVKQVEESTGKNLPTIDMQKVEDGEKKSSLLEKEKEDRKKTSDSKQLVHTLSSKLPPVCLRVDPLPRKKRTNGASRSPSPPTHKDREKSHQEETQHKSSLKKSKDAAAIKEIKVDESNKNPEIEVKGKSQNSGKNVLEEPECVVGVQHKASMGTGATLEAVTSNEQQKGLNAEGIADHGASKIEEEKSNKEAQGISVGCEKKDRRVLSPVEAAVLIQAAYRGFEVRRWQPLEKLHKIKNICKQLDDVRKQIQDLEAASGKLDKKQMMVIGETIMSLLLQLDTIQGLHQCVREARKAVTKDLINLQEKLDELRAECEHETIKNHGSKVTALSDIAAGGLNAAAVETDNSQLSSELTHDVIISVDKSQEEVEEERHIEEKVSDSSNTITDTSDRLAREAISSCSGEDDKATQCLIQENDSEILKPLDTRREPSSDMKEFETSPVSTVDEAVRRLSVPTDDDHSSPAESETSLEAEESQKLSALGSGDIGKEFSLPDRVAPKMEFIVSANEGSGSQIVSVKDVLVDSNASADVKPEVKLNQVVPAVEGEKGGAEPTSGEPGFSSNVTGSMELPPEQMQRASEISASEVEAENIVSENNDLVKDEIAEEPELSSYEAGSKELPLGKLQLAPEISTSEPVADGTASESATVSCTVEDEIAEESAASGKVGSIDIPEQMQSELEGEHADSENDVVKDAVVEYLSTAIDGGIFVEKEDVPVLDHPAATDGRDDLPASEDGANSAPDFENAPGATIVPRSGPSEEEKKLLEENEKLRETQERVLEVVKSHLGQISDLSGRIKELERKLAQKKKARAKRYMVRRSPASHRVALLRGTS